MNIKVFQSIFKESLAEKALFSFETMSRRYDVMSFSTFNTYSITKSKTFSANDLLSKEVLKDIVEFASTLGQKEPMAVCEIPLIWDKGTLEFTRFPKFFAIVDLRSDSCEKEHVFSTCRIIKFFEEKSHKAPEFLVPRWVSEIDWVKHSKSWSP